MSSQQNGTETKPRSAFSGRLGYIMAVAGSAVGLGNIWRFPYLAARYGGGIFVLVYLVLLVTVGYALIMSETALGRMTGRSPVGAFAHFGRGRGVRLGGWINAIVPFIIVPYYCVIGGWVVKFLFEYLRGHTSQLATDGYFNTFLGTTGAPLVFFFIFAALTAIVVVTGVEKGIEKVSKILMPALVVLAVVVAGYSVTLPGALEGVKYLLLPDFSQFSIMTVVAAMGQMFFSLSIAMGILYTYGSYMKKDIDMDKSTKQIEIFDTGIALLAGLMIVPAVFAFSGGDPSALNAGPSLMFITIPKVFDSMGLGSVFGIVFFLLVLFAALTSSISLMESGVSTVQDQTGWSRRACSALVLGIILVVGALCSLGYGALSFVQPFGMAILDFFDFLSNSILMPIAALFTCFLVVRVAGVRTIAGEVRLSSQFRRERLYRVCITYVAPLCLIVILLSSIASTLGWISL